ncbi:MAG TPA: 3-deoxy-7-phosphoheptulonate synthase [Actinomycetota bacterium]
MGEANAWVVVLGREVAASDAKRVAGAVGELQPGVALTRGDAWSAIAFADGRHEDQVEALRSLPGVERVVPVSAPYRLASREVFETDVAVHIGDDREGASFDLGGSAPICVVAALGERRRSREERVRLATEVRAAGAAVLLAGRVGHGSGGGGSDALSVDDLRTLRDVTLDADLALAAEVSDLRQVDEVASLVDLVQVGGASMQDFNLLRELGRAERPVVLRRGSGSIVEEFLLAAEYVLTHGNGRAILCESGIRTFDATYAPRFEINAVPVIKRATHLPVIADPSHATAHPRLVPAVAKAAVAAGADGLVLELADGPSGDDEAIGMSEFHTLMEELEPIAAAVGRRVR